MSNFFLIMIINTTLKVIILTLLPASQFFVTDAFLANQFYYYGIDIFNYYRYTSCNP